MEKLPKFSGWHMGQVGTEPMPMIHHIHDLMSAQPWHTCFALGLMVFIVLAYIFHL